MQSRKTSLKIAICALFLALIIAFSYIPNLGYITIGPISFTTIHILVLVSAIIFGKWIGTIVGTFFGIFSLLIAIQYPGTVNYLFLNPFVSILPRILFGFISGALFDYFRKRTNKQTFLAISAPLSAVLTLLHTFLTLSCLYIFGYLDIFKISEALGMKEIIEANQNLFGSFGNFIITFIAPGTVCEAIVPIIIVPSIATLYAFNKLPMNFYKLNIVQELGTKDKLISLKTTILIVIILAIITLSLCGTILALFYL